MLILSTMLCALSCTPLAEEKTIVAQKIAYLGVGVAFGSASLLARFGWEISQITPWASTVGNECLLLNHLCGAAAHRAFHQMLQGPSTDSVQSWQENQALLSQIEPSSSQDSHLLNFLKNRWLAKSTGFIPPMVKWVYPCFGIHLQIHPMSSHTYARNPSVGISQNYQAIVDDWKKVLPQPQEYPLILTRPFDIGPYLPDFLDLTEILTSSDPDEWLRSWESCRKELLKAEKLPICIQRVEKNGIGGLRLLPLTPGDEPYLLEWISQFGLTANRVEMDRWPLPHPQTPAVSLQFLSQKEFFSFIDHFKWNSSHPQKNLMVESTRKLLSGLKAASLENLSKTEKSVAEIAFYKIKQELQHLSAEDSFFTVASHLELIHADLSSLLEVLAPFTDFAPIYQKALTSISAEPSCGIFSSGMTCLTGILKTVGKNPRVLYGENTYFETSLALEQIARASPIEDSKEQDWKEVDLVIAQFNPVLKRLDLEPTEYLVEPIAERLRNIFSSGRTKPLTVALDCTLDFINSPRIEKLLTEFQPEIENGSLQIISYRSGLKFDLFGMDNYCGAPIYLIHNHDEKWKPFEEMLKDPSLQADSLSQRWFCLAYEQTAPELDLYRKQIFANTRALMDKIPARLFKNQTYRIIPARPDADLAFIDIKVSGPLHKFRSAAFVSGCLYLHAMEANHPIFNRPSLGFYHPNFTMIFTEEFSTIRLTIGLDPSQIDVLAHCFEMIDTLNGTPQQIAVNLLQE